MLTGWKNKNYDSILIIIDYLAKIIYYKLVKIIINISDLAEFIINLIIYHYDTLK